MTVPALLLAQKLIRLPSFTPTNPAAPEDYAACLSTLNLLAEAARKGGAHMVRIQEHEGGDEKYPYKVANLVVRWTKSYGHKIPRTLCYLGHTDVVRQTSETDGWTRDPFGAEVEDDILYGRGATDMKGSVAAFFTAMQQLWDDPDAYYDVYAIITTDEEWAAINGTKRVLQWMSEQAIRPDAFLVGEPSADKVFGDTLASGRRGSLNGEITVHGVSGHTAYPSTFINPVWGATRVVHELWKYAFREEETTRFREKTRLEVTDIVTNGGGSTSVVPASVTVKWNIRFTSHYTPEELDRMVKCVAPGEADKKIVSFATNLAYVSKPYFGNPDELCDVIGWAVRRELDITDILETHAGGTSDGRFVQEYFPNAEVLELGPPVNGGLPSSHPDYRSKGGMHQPDECLSLTDLGRMTDVYRLVVPAYCNQRHGVAVPRRKSVPFSAQSEDLIR